MNHAAFRLLAITLVGATALSACAMFGEYKPKPEFDYTPFVTREVQTVHVPMVDSWDNAGKDKLLLTTSPNKAYLLTLFGPCWNLDFEHNIAFTSDGMSLRAGIDSIYTDRERCRVQRIHEIDYKKAKMAREEQRKKEAAAKAAAKQAATPAS